MPLVALKPHLHLLVVTTFVSLAGCSGHYQNSRFYYADCLWDGEQCGVIEGGCCGATGLPLVPQDTIHCDYIELRTCCNQGTRDEDVPSVGLYEIYYVKDF